MCVIRDIQIDAKSSNVNRPNRQKEKLQNAEKNLYNSPKKILTKRRKISLQNAEKYHNVNMTKYRNRIVDSILQDKLEAKGVVLIEGPKWCG